MLKSLRFFFFFFILILQGVITAQLDLKISADKTEYDYGETIEITCTVTNISDTTFSVMAGCTDSFQAEFYLNNFYSRDWSACFTTMQELVFTSGSSKVYKWIIDPVRYGIPNQEGTQMLVGEYFHDNLRDTIYFSAPEYLGGQLNITFPIDISSSLDSLRDSLNVTVLEHNEYAQLDKTHELWQIEGFDLDSIYGELSEDIRLIAVEYNRHTQYESIVVSLEGNVDEPVSDFYLSNAYPNPFNPVASFYVTIPEQMNVKIELFNALGQSAQQIYNGILESNRKYCFEINGSELSSGIYYYNASGVGFNKTGKVALLK